MEFDASAWLGPTLILLRVDAPRPKRVVAKGAEGSARLPYATSCASFTSLGTRPARRSSSYQIPASRSSCSNTGRISSILLVKPYVTAGGIVASYFRYTNPRACNIRSRSANTRDDIPVVFRRNIPNRVGPSCPSTHRMCIVHGRVKIANKPPVAHGMGVSGQPVGTVSLVRFAIAILLNLVSYT